MVSFTKQDRQVFTGEGTIGKAQGIPGRIHFGECSVARPGGARATMGNTRVVSQGLTDGHSRNDGILKTYLSQPASAADCQCWHAYTTVHAAVCARKSFVHSAQNAHDRLLADACSCSGSGPIGSRNCQWIRLDRKRREEGKGARRRAHTEVRRARAATAGQGWLTRASQLAN